MDKYTIEIRKGVGQRKIHLGIWKNVWTYNVLVNGRTVRTFLYEDEAKAFVQGYRTANPQSRHDGK